LRIEPTHPLIDLRTPLRLIPRFWLELIEPRIRRDGSCWLWDGAVDLDGEPVITIKNLDRGGRTTRRLKRIIVTHFWELTDDITVLHSCKTQNCLNPQHFYVTRLKWNEAGLREEINKIATRIRRWGKAHA
jgi:hypothetical protein